MITVIAMNKLTKEHIIVQDVYDIMMIDTPRGSSNFRLLFRATSDGKNYQKYDIPMGMYSVRIEEINQ